MLDSMWVVLPTLENVLLSTMMVRSGQLVTEYLSI
jgi:hypothetical protein